jgi:hypothetical protein
VTVKARRQAARHPHAGLAQQQQLPLHVQLETFSGGGKARGATLTLLEQIDRIAVLHDQQGRHDARITITREQSTRLSQSLRLPDGVLRWRGHPINVIEETKR